MKWLSNRLIFFCVMIVVVSVGCYRSTVQPGVETTIQGVIQDFKLQKPTAGVLIYVTEYRSRSLFGRGSWFKVLDSTVSGPDGRYQMTFKATGKGDTYSIHISPGKKLFAPTVSQYFTPGGLITIDFNVFHVSTLKAMLQIVNNPRPPLWINTGDAGGQLAINGTNKDTTIYLNIRPDQENYVNFYIISGPDSAQYYNTRTDTILFSGFADTFSRSFQLDPRTFPRR